MSNLHSIQHLLDDESIVQQHVIQSLWSGYGQVARYQSQQTKQTFVVKSIDLAPVKSHPRGWNTNLGHERKVTSYFVEANFYQHYAATTNTSNYVPRLHGLSQTPSSIVLVMDDLEALGYNRYFETADDNTFHRSIAWLANFHAEFMFKEVKALWPIGSYWHLATRQDEWQAIPNGLVKQLAGHFDQQLEEASFKTLLHGDAKLQNLCFHHSKPDVAAVDFQYTGSGVGVKDLAYLAASSLSNDQLKKYDLSILTMYLDALESALETRGKAQDFSKLAEEYRRLYPIAWADFYRFLLGWNPNSPKISHYMLAITDKAIKQVRAT